MPAARRPATRKPVPTTTPALPPRRACPPALLHCGQPVDVAAVVAAWRPHDHDMQKAFADGGAACVRAYLKGLLPVIDEVLTDRSPSEYSVRRYAATHTARAIADAFLRCRLALDPTPEPSPLPDDDAWFDVVHGTAEVA
ncbi:MAG: hypothetical protein U0324_44275 [Polyangiales bacterium]